VRRALRLALPVLVIAGVLLFPAAAQAHPLGNFTINTSAGLVFSPGAVRVDYVVDMAEIPTVQVRPQLDADGDGTITDAERAAFAKATAPTLLANLSLRIGGREIPMTVRGADVTLLPGQGGLDILRLEATFVGSVDGDTGSFTFDDRNYEGRVGWHEVTAAGIDGTALTHSTVPVTSISDQLRTYPQDLLSSPLDIRTARASFAPGVSVGGSVQPVSNGVARPGVIGGAFADLVDRTGPLMLLALLLAFGFGAIHALGPGHGKTLMAAYLVGAGGRTRQAVAVGGAVATMHTASVLALGFVVLAATSVFAPERVYPWLGLASGVIALGLGSILLVTRLAAWSSNGRRHDLAAPAHGEHVHAEHAHEHSDHAHEHEHGGHTHVHELPTEGVLSKKGLIALAVAGGILPSPTALVVLLASVAIHRVAYGLALIGAFSVGLATALVVVGILALRARDVVQRRMSHRTARLVPVLSASAIAVLGLVLTVNGVRAL
jgi:ABC-type nickel/cobalt efflux system permease component RcnA